jgi:hypothetical protein
VGLYEGLAEANSLRATFTVAGKVGLLPWVIWIGMLLVLETLRRHSGRTWNLDDSLLNVLWAGTHLLVCLGFLAHATWRLRRHFRSLAARTHEPAWWKRWPRLRRTNTV